MDDAKIIELFWARNENAITAVSEKYGAYCRIIAKNILGNSEDAEECVNNTYLSAWNSIPPNKPEKLCAYLGKSFPNNSYIVIFIQILCFAYFPELHTHSYYIRKKAKLLSICCPRRIFVVRTHTENPSQKMSNFDKLLNDSCFF